MTTPTCTVNLTPTRTPVARRVWNSFRTFMAGFDAAALLTHGTDVPPDHPARRKEREQEIEQRIAVRYPRT